MGRFGEGLLIAARLGALLGLLEQTANLPLLDFEHFKLPR